MRNLKIRILFSAIFIIGIVFQSAAVCVFADTQKVFYQNTFDSQTLELKENYGLQTQIEENPPFRQSGDKALKIYGTSTESSMSASSGKNYLWPYNTRIDTKNYNKITVGFDFLLKKEGTAVSLRAEQISGERTTFFTLDAGGKVEINTWNRVELVLGSDGTDNTYDIYLNGSRIGGDVTAAGSYGLNSNSWIMLNVDKDAPFEAYIDNIQIKGCNEYVSASKPCIESDIYEISENVIKVPSGTSVSTLSEALSCDGANIGFYGEDDIALSSSYIFTGGERAVAYNSEGIYSFYSIAMAAEKFWDGSTAVKKATTLGGMTIEDNVTDGPVKTASDSVYRISGTALTDMTATTHGQGYINLALGDIIGDTKNYDSFLVEFDFCLQKENTGLFFRGQQYIEGKAETEYTGSDRQDFAVVKVGDTFGGEKVEAMRWYRLTLVCDADNAGDDAGKCSFYINGVFAGENSLKEGAYGFKQFGWICPMVSNAEYFDLYLDNISVRAGSNLFFGYDCAKIEGLGSGLEVNEERKKIYGVTSSLTVNDVQSGADLSENASAIYVVDSDFKIQPSEASVGAGWEAVVISSDGIYAYYKMRPGKRYPYFQSFAALEDSPVYAVYAESETAFYDIPTDGAEISLEFNCDFIDASSVNADNIYLTLNGEKTGEVTVNAVSTGGMVQGAVLSASGLENGKEYVLNVRGISAGGEVMTAMQSVSFVTRSSGIGSPPMMPEMIINDVSGSGWTKYGSASHKITYEADSEQGTVVTVSNRSGAWQGIKQIISYDRYYKYTGNEPGTASKLRLSFDFKMDGSSGEKTVLTIAWYANNTVVSGSTYTLSLPADGDWTHIEQNIDMAVPESVSVDSGSYLRIHIEDKNGSVVPDTFNDFSIANFSLCKYYEKKEINLSIDENSVLRTLSGAPLGFAYENGRWYYPDAGAVLVSNTSNEFKQSFLDYAQNLGFNVIRIGGYYSNYDFWKCSIGPLSSRIPTQAPAPAWDTAKDYWRNGIEYIGPIERLNLAESMGDAVSLIICTNIWSYLKDIDYTKNYTESIAPSYIVNTETQEFDTDALDIAVNDMLDLIRFLTLTPDDENAVGTDGINWAQKRVDLGHETPYNIGAWELGNELELRGVSSQTYYDMCKYIIPKIRAVFPNVKIAVSADALGGLKGWAQGMESLACDIEFVSTHKYYDYNKIGACTQGIGNIQSLIEGSENPDIKILITEGGLDTFREYTGPSNQSMAMCTSFAYFMNDAVKYKNFESFQYYGNPVQICYNKGAGFQYGWRYYGDGSLAIAEETDGSDTVVAVSGRKRYQTGIQQGIPLGSFISQGHNIGETRQYSISYDVKFDSASSDGSKEPMVVKLAWCRDSSDVVSSVIHSEIIKDYTPGEWIHREFKTGITVPKELEGASGAHMLIIICGNAQTQTLSEIRVKNFSVTREDFQNPVFNRYSVYSTENDDFRDTALAELMKCYISNALGDIVLTENSDIVSSSYVSQLAVKTDDGINLFIANLNDKSEYRVNLVSDNEYAVNGKYMLYADSLYAEKNALSDDIYSVREAYCPGVSAKSFILPKNSVMVLHLTALSENIGSKIAEKISFDDKAVSISGNNNGASFDIIAVFKSKSGDSELCMKHVNSSDTSIDCTFTWDQDYSEVELFKWQTGNIAPLAKKEIYKISDI